MKVPSLHALCFFAILCLAPSAGIWAQPPDGAVVAWGDSLAGECTVPAPNIGFVAVSAGGAHSLGLRQDGVIIAWGSNLAGQCTVPEPNTDFVQVAAGGAYSLGLKSDGTVLAWGANYYQQCNVPQPNSDFVSLAAGYDYCLGMKANGSIVAWGSNASGQCTVPTPNAGFVAIAAGGAHCLGLKADGSLVAWGDNQYGLNIVPEPNAGFKAMAANGLFSMGLYETGAVVVWGHCGDGKCDVPLPNSNYRLVSAGEWHALALRRDGSVAAWGQQSYGQCQVPTPNSSFVAISGGDRHSLGIRDVPFAVTVSDVPGDQGGRLRVSWRRHRLDSPVAPMPILVYSVESWSDDWLTIAEISSAQDDSYYIDLDTPHVLVAGMPVQLCSYRVVARTANPHWFYLSLPDSGYSIDNLPPAPPSLEIFDSETSRSLVWQNPTPADFDETCLYRGEAPGFEGGDPLLCFATQFWYQETNLNRYWYRARSFDIHGNASEWSNEVVGRYPTGVPGTPTALRLYPNQPNPFNPLTTLRFDVPVGGRVRLEVYDVAGRLIRTLLDADLPAGSHQAVWDGTDERGLGVASGSYVARLSADGKVETVRMGLVK